MDSFGLQQRFDEGKVILLLFVFYLVVGDSLAKQT